jgi:branched-chain amino acid transport system substrate-binding protein
MHTESWRASGTAAAACALLALALVSCSLDPVRLGAVLPLTGVHSTYGSSLNKGVLVAVERVNAEGGIHGRRLEVIVRDSGSDAQEAVRQFRGLATAQGVAAVVGGATSPEALALAPVAAELRVVLLTPSASSPRLRSAGEWVFRNWPSDDLEAKVMAEFAAFTLHASAVLVVAEQSAYARGFAESFVSQFSGPDRTARTAAFPGGDPGAPEWGRQLAADLHGAQAILLVGYGEQLLPAVAALRARGVDAPLLSVSSLSDEQVLAKGAAELEGVVFARPSYDPESDSPSYQEFAVACRSRFGSEPDVYAAHAYDSVRVLAEALALEGLDPAGAQRGLRKTRGFPGAAGAVTFDAGGDAVQTFDLCVITGGRVVSLAWAGEEVLPELQRRVERLRFAP